MLNSCTQPAQPLKFKSGLPTTQAGAQKVALNSPQFGSLLTTSSLAMQRAPISNRLKSFDFQNLAVATINQIQVIYGMCLLSRTYNSWKRSPNELRETITRDSMGYTFWFFGTPILQRLFLKAFAPPNYKDALLEIKKTPISKNPTGLNIQHKLSSINQKINPLAHFSLPTTRQVKNQMQHALLRIEQSGYKEGSPEFTKIENYYKNLVKWRNFATGLGYIVTIGLIGIGINLYNIHMTRKKNAKLEQPTMSPSVPSMPMNFAAQPIPVAPRAFTA